MAMKILLYDSQSRQKREFVSITPNEVRIYVCGPTVYDDAHLGHARSSIAFDLWRRVFLANGYQVMYAKNFTDIDDKIINKMHQTNQTLEELTNHYIEAYLSDMDRLGVLRGDIEPRATQNLVSIQAMIDELLKRGYAYLGQNGDVYLQVQKDSKYGKLSHHNVENTQSRIQNADDKLESRDFALWKGYKGQGDVSFESSFGAGRPGWHIECSAMIESHLAYKDKDFAIDIHAGGSDLLFPHHENEASQTRCATDRELAKYWLHNGFVNINGEKMSKSLGNSFFIKDALKVYDGEILRNYLLGVHYRGVLDFNEEDLLSSKKRLDKLYRLKKRLKISQSTQEAITSLDSQQTLESSVFGRIAKHANNEFITNFLQSLNDDLNISKALSVLEEMLNNANEYIDKFPKDSAFMEVVAYNIAFIALTLGIGGKDASEYFQLGVNKEEKQKIQTLIAQRLQAKQEKNYAKADSLRDELKAMGIEIMDSPQGTIWEKV